MIHTNRPLGKISYQNEGRVVLVTGGAQGIGWAISRAFANSGAKVMCVDVSIDQLTELPAGIAMHQADTSKEQECRLAVDAAVDLFGGLDILVNNAAIQPPESYAPVDLLDSSMATRMVNVNFFGYTFMAKYALQQMKRQQSGVIVNIASAQGHRTTRGVPIYGPLKAANILQAMQWAVEYARDGIRVVSVSPGAIDTPLVRATLEAQGGAEALANRHPLGRIGQPEEIASAVLWLSSSDASFITGTDLQVDGGLGASGAFAEPYSD